MTAVSLRTARSWAKQTPPARGAFKEGQTHVPESTTSMSLYLRRTPDARRLQISDRLVSRPRLLPTSTAPLLWEGAMTSRRPSDHPQAPGVERQLIREARAEAVELLLIELRRRRPVP